jgi:hypothetical protein
MIMENTKNLQETIELKTDIPEGYEIDRENSTFECIKLKRIRNRWRDTVSKLNGFTIGGFGGIEATGAVSTKGCGGHGIFATEKIAKSALAMAQISQIMANDNRFGGIITDKEWEDDDVDKYVIVRSNNKIEVFKYWTRYYFLAFRTLGQCNLFLEENEDLVKDYFMID